MINQSFDFENFSVHFEEWESEFRDILVDVRLLEKKTNRRWIGEWYEGNFLFRTSIHSSNGGAIHPVPVKLKKECLKIWKRLKKMESFQ